LFSTSFYSLWACNPHIVSKDLNDIETFTMAGEIVEGATKSVSDLPIVNLGSRKRKILLLAYLNSKNVSFIV
jgi:hypothetical protein